MEVNFTLYVYNLYDSTNLLSKSTIQSIRDRVAASKTWAGVVDLLAADQRDLVYTSVGVIVNMMSDADKRTSLRSHISSYIFFSLSLKLLLYVCTFFFIFSCTPLQFHSLLLIVNICQKHVVFLIYLNWLPTLDRFLLSAVKRQKELGPTHINYGFALRNNV